MKLILLIITLFAIVVKIEFQSREREKADKAGVLKSIETLEFFDDILVIKSTAFKGKSKIKYYKFYEVIETKNYFIIYFNRRQASIIRKIDLEDSLVDELRNLLTGKIGRKYKNFLNNILEYKIIKGMYENLVINLFYILPFFFYF